MTPSSGPSSAWSTSSRLRSRHADPPHRGGRQNTRENKASRPQSLCRSWASGRRPRGSSPILGEAGFEAIILMEQANQGRTIIEKFEAHGDVGYAVVVLTPGDEGNTKAKPSQPRARQNVIFELGYFVCRLGRSRIMALVEGQIEIPSDLQGVVHEPYTTGGAWKQALSRELAAAGFEIDCNVIMKS
ncbi:nucleotide-binding protein [Mesorhizobium onobrychidis]|uniref:nucleotide-binding protein n=1 Tax=Mesorhizobium onobrychidis TaxID=2775404 RepID=UPI00215798A2|nr:nucleotide-binding protein [Mesorhizobium onobrychidis]